MIVLILLGIAAGLITTVAGVGGGFMLVLTLSLLGDARAALAITAPALFVGNAHRFWLFRHAVERRVLTLFVLGALPGAVIGSLVAVSIPEAVLRWMLVLTTVLVVVRGLGWIRWEPSRRALVPAGMLAAFVAAASGAGLLVAPILLTAGLTGDAFVATAAASAVVIHGGRLLGYGAGGMLTQDALIQAAFLAPAVIGGNSLGKMIRRRFSEDWSNRLTHGVLLLLVACALLGVA